MEINSIRIIDKQCYIGLVYKDMTIKDIRQDTVSTIIDINFVSHQSLPWPDPYMHMSIRIYLISKRIFIRVPWDTIYIDGIPSAEYMASPFQLLGFCRPIIVDSIQNHISSRR